MIAVSFPAGGKRVKALLCPFDSLSPQKITAELLQNTIGSFTLNVTHYGWLGGAEGVGGDLCVSHLGEGTSF